MELFRRYWDTAFAIDLLLLALAAPALYAPFRLGKVAVALALMTLVAAWMARRIWLGRWYERTPADLPIAVLMGVMLPIALWVTPLPLRMYSWPKALVLVWNFHLFAVIVTNVGRRPRLLIPALTLFVSLAFLFSLVAPLGTNWLYKLPGTEPILGSLPIGLGILSREGGRGFHPNIVAGALLYVLPLMLAVTWVGIRRGFRRPQIWILAAVTLYVLVVFLLLQSRGGYIGLTVAVIAMGALQFRRGRWLLLLAALALFPTIVWGGIPLLSFLAENPTAMTVGGIESLQNFRAEIWNVGILAVSDFPLTGVGLGIFQNVVELLYPLDIPSDYYFGHAHNFWLQGAIDFGLPGLVALVAIYLVAIAQIVSIWGADEEMAGVITGLTGCLIAQSIFSLTDAIPMGSTANILFWLMFGLIFATGNAAQNTKRYHTAS